MGQMIRAASLRGFVPLVEQLGGDADALLGRFGFSRELIAADDELVPITAHDQMLDTAADVLDCPDLGLRLAERQDLGVLGPLAVAIESSSTVADALACASRFLFVHSPALSIQVEDDPWGAAGVVALTYRKNLHESPYSPQAMELGLGLFHLVARVLIGLETRVRSVEVPHAPLSPVVRYTDYFGTDVKFDRPTGALRVERALLDRNFATANETIRRVAVDYLAGHFTDPGEQVAGRVRRVLSESLRTTRPAIGNVARLLAMHPRTLQRRLAAEHTTFEDVLDEVRRDAAHRYITTTGVPLGEVAAMVGFAEQSTLSHAVRRWFDATPRELRRAAASGNVSH